MSVLVLSQVFSTLKTIVIINLVTTDINLVFLCLFLDLYRDLESCSNRGIENYGVSMTTLNEVFLKLEGRSAIDESGNK